MMLYCCISTVITISVTTELISWSLFFISYLHEAGSQPQPYWVTRNLFKEVKEVKETFFTADFHYHTIQHHLVS